MSITDPDLQRAVGEVSEPTLGRPLAELGMIRGATVSGDRGHVLVALPEALVADRVEVQRRVERAAGDLGLGGVDVEYVTMSPEEEAGVRRAVIGDPAATAGGEAHGHAEGRSVTFADPASRTRVLLIASGKGGVGKSSVTTNLATALAGRGHSTAIIDADVWGFSIPRMLGIDSPPGVIDQMIIPPEANGVKCISMGFFAAEDQPVIWRGPMLHKALEQFLTDVFWDEPDYLLIDLPPGTGDISLSLAQFLPRAEVIVVTTPQPAAQTVAQRAAYMAHKVKLTVRGVIENMSWFTGDDGKRYELFGSGGGEDLAAKLDVPLLGRIPLVPAIREGGDVGTPVVTARPDSEATAIFSEIARLLDEEYKPTLRYNEGLKLL